MTNKSSFEEGTTEAYWGPEGSEQNKYVLRHIHGETCCESPYADVPDWPVLEWIIEPGSEYDNEDGEGRKRVLSVIAGVWVKETGKFVAFWAADENDDSHVEFYVRKDYEDLDDFPAISGLLCTEICPELIDVFDDGSGTDRDPIDTPESVFGNELLNNLYAAK